MFASTFSSLKSPRKSLERLGLVSFACLLCFLLADFVLGQGGLSVTASSGTPSPDPAIIDEEISVSLSASASNPPSPGSGCSLNGPIWSWKITNIEYSADGASWGSSPGGDSEHICHSSSSTATLYLTCTDEENDGGYWRITCQATAAYDDGMCGQKWSASGTTQPKAKVLTVTILRKPAGGADYLPIKDDNQNLLVGQFVNLKAKIMPDGTAGTYLWKNPPGVTFYDYTCTAAVGTLTKLPADGAPDPGGLLTSSVLWFYWEDAGDGRKVVCTFTPTVGKAATNPETTLNVKSPTVNPAFTSNQGLTAFNAGPTRMRLHKGPATVAGGIEFSATVNVPAPFAAGQWQFVQTGVMARTFTDAGGVGWHADMNGQTVLDGAVPYPFQNNAGAVGNTLAATLKVTAVDGAGAITGIAVANGGSYTVAPANPVAVTAAGGQPSI